MAGIVGGANGTSSGQNVKRFQGKPLANPGNGNGGGAKLTLVPRETYTPGQQGNSDMKALKNMAIKSKADPKASAVRGATESHAKAEANWGSMQEAYAGLPVEDQKGAGKSGFYQMASDSGQFKNADGTNKRPADIRKEFAGYDDKTRANAEGKVKEWGQENPDMMRMSLASGFAGYAADQVTAMDMTKQQTPAEMTRTQGLFDVYQNGNGFVENRGAYVDNLYQLHQMGEKDTVRQLSQKLDG